MTTAVALAIPVTSATANRPPPRPPFRPASPATPASTPSTITGFALCRNNGSQTQTFWVHLVCGWAPDIDGNHITLRPGESGQSTAHCGSSARASARSTSARDAGAVGPYRPGSRISPTG
ncbi:hypothetical protein SMICM17S_12542 [Streptomyces microflavus]